MEVLGLCSFPVQSAATRYRLIQYKIPLAKKGINLTVVPFLSDKEFASFYRRGKTIQKAAAVLSFAAKRFIDSFSASKFDSLLIQREAMLFGPPVFEWLNKTIGKCPLILDLDDATYIPYVSPTYGRLSSAIKFFGKTDTLIDWSETVICGNSHLADYVTGKGKKAVVIPTVVNTDKFHPIEKAAGKTPIVGWIGTHSTFPLLETLFPVLQDLARKYDFTLKIVGAGTDEIEVEGVRVENSVWKLESEIEDFQSLDIGLYPLETSGSISKEWLMGKSGFKAIQYMSIGIPFVVTPVGVCSEIGIENETHFAASNKEQWYKSLSRLLESAALRKKMGENGRAFALRHYTVPRQTDKIADVLRFALENFHQKTGKQFAAQKEGL